MLLFRGEDRRLLRTSQTAETRRFGRKALRRWLEAKDRREYVLASGEWPGKPELVVDHDAFGAPSGSNIELALVEARERDDPAWFRSFYIATSQVGDPYREARVAVVRAMRALQTELGIPLSDRVPLALATFRLVDLIADPKTPRAERDRALAVFNGLGKLFGHFVATSDGARRRKP